MDFEKIDEKEQSNLSLKQIWSFPKMIVTKSYLKLTKMFEVKTFN
jgi:hypothetical protein